MVGLVANISELAAPVGIVSAAPHVLASLEHVDRLSATISAILDTVSDLTSEPEPSGAVTEVVT